MHEERNLNRAHEKYLEYAPQEPIDAMHQKGENVIYMRVSDRKKGRSLAMRLVRLCMEFNILNQLPGNIILSKSYDMATSRIRYLCGQQIYVFSTWAWQN